MTFLKNYKKGAARAWLLVLMLSVGVLAVHPWRQGQAKAGVSRRALKELPSRVGDWQKIGMDQRFDAAAEQVLNSDDYILRNYELPQGEKVSLFVGYYENLELSSNWHSPTVCLPGSGWNISQQTEAEIPVGDASKFAANTYLIQKGSERLVMLYWFQGRGRFTSGNFWNKVYSTFDGLRRRRADGAIVRVLVPVDKTVNESLTTAKSFAAQIAPNLSPYVPQ
jgi:EpsI family protein